MKYNIILNITTSCNYDCSYCDVVKDKKIISKDNLDNILEFIKNNKNYIDIFKFFWWEPLLAFNNIKYIIDNSNKYIWNNYEIVTNTSLLTNEIWEYFERYFKIIFLSIDTENFFDFNNVKKITDKYNLESKVYFNLIINPWEEEQSLQLFYKLYALWYKWYNILPVYFTKNWSKKNLQELSEVIKIILDLWLKDKKLRFFWFQKNLWKEISLINNSIFLDINLKIYYSDIISTFMWYKIKNKLFLWNVLNFNVPKLKEINFNHMDETISLLEEKVYNNTKWQRELKKIMDYFSKYLNSYKWI